MKFSQRRLIEFELPREDIGPVLTIVGHPEARWSLSRIKHSQAVSRVVRAVTLREQAVGSHMWAAHDRKVPHARVVSALFATLTLNQMVNTRRWFKKQLAIALRRTTP